MKEFGIVNYAMGVSGVLPFVPSLEMAFFVFFTFFFFKRITAGLPP